MQSKAGPLIKKYVSLDQLRDHPHPTCQAMQRLLYLEARMPPDGFALVLAGWINA